MLAFKYRFHGHGSIRYVYARGQAVRGRTLTLKWTKNPRRNSVRIAVVISKKVLKGAVGRNRIRRRVYEHIRSRMGDIASPHDLVFIVSSAELRSYTSSELAEAVDQLLHEANLYKTP